MMAHNIKITSGTIWPEEKTTQAKEALVEELTKSKESMIKRIEQLESIIESVNKLPFNKGSIVYHKEYGVCIVQHLYHNHGCRIEPENFKNFLYVTVAHAEGNTEVLATELIPKTEMSEAIYE